EVDGDVVPLPRRLLDRRHALVALRLAARELARAPHVQHLRVHLPRAWLDQPDARLTVGRLRLRHAHRFTSRCGTRAARVASAPRGRPALLQPTALPRLTSRSGTPASWPPLAPRPRARR